MCQNAQTPMKIHGVYHMTIKNNKYIHMKKIYFKFIAVFILFGFSSLVAQVPTWQLAFSAGYNGNESVSAIAVDAAGNSYITGSYTSSYINFGTFSLLNSFSGTSDIFLVKIDPAGVVVWAKTFGGADGDQGNGLAVDASGNVILTGWFASASITFSATVLNNVGTASSDLFAVKYDSDGNLIWAKSAGGSGNDRGYAVSCDANSNVFVTGWYTSPSINFGTGNLMNAGSASTDVFIVKYDASGSTLWAKTIGGTAADGARACANDASGNTYVLGSFSSSSVNFGTGVLTNASAGTYDLFLAKYDPSGTALWSTKVGGIYDEMGNAIAVSGNNIYLTGSFTSASINFGSLPALTNASAGTSDIFLASYSSIGTANWSKASGGADADEAKCICVDASGNAFISGSFISSSITFGTNTLTNSAAGTKDMFVASFDNTGNSPWALQAGSYSEEVGNGIANSNTSSVIHLGGMFNSSSVSFGTSNVYKGCGDDVFYAKLDATTGINDAWHSLNENVVIFPNPSSTGIFSISDELENTEIDIYNVLGEKVYSTKHFQNTIDLSSQAKGVYVIQFILKAQTHSQKIIIE